MIDQISNGCGSEPAKPGSLKRGVSEHDLTPEFLALLKRSSANELLVLQYEARKAGDMPVLNAVLKELGEIHRAMLANAPHEPRGANH